MSRGARGDIGRGGEVGNLDLRIKLQKNDDSDIEPSLHLVLWVIGAVGRASRGDRLIVFPSRSPSAATSQPSVRSL